MKREYSIFFLILAIVSNMSFAQSACNGLLPFEEQNGLLTIEMESGVINDDRWKIATETFEGEQVTYLHWTGAQSFSALSGAPIVYKIKINNPGTYRFAWRMRVGLGESKGEHNDAWLKIDAEDFYGIKDNAKVYPKPLCNSDPNLTCAAGTSTQGYMKAFGNRLDYGFVTNTNDHVAHRVWVVFSEAKEYTITVDARSSYLFIDRMVLHRSDVSGSVAFNMSNPESSCYDELSIDAIEGVGEIELFPNPTNGIVQMKNLPVNSTLVISNIFGSVVREKNISEPNEDIDISTLEKGVYFFSIKNKLKSFVQKVIKI